MNHLYADRRMAVKPFEKITNFRDIGALPTEDGRMMKTGILFRSGEPWRLIEGRDGNAVVYVSGEAYPCAMTLNQLESRLRTFGFFRCHRSYLVNLQQVREIEAWTKDSYILKLDDKTGSTVPLFRSNYMELKEQFKI